MIGTVAALWRHPIKSHGFEALRSVQLTAGAAMPGDRLWAVAHEASTIDGSVWGPCANFSRGSKAGRLVAMRAELSEDMTQITLTHPDLPPLTFAPDENPPEFFDWVRPLMPTDRAASARIVRSPGIGTGADAGAGAGHRGWTDSDFPSVSILSTSSLAALSDHLGTPLAQQRFRGNIWLDGMAPWAEWDLVGQSLRIGTAEFLVRERITRCTATQIDPETGHPTADTLAGLQSGWGHKDFGIYAEITKPGAVAPGDTAEVL